MTTREQLESRLRASKARLVGRQVMRSAYNGAAGAACGLGLGVVFLELLPRLLFATSFGVAPLLAAAAIGAIAVMIWELRRYRAPSLQDTALALEARLAADTGALAAALRVQESDPFFVPLLARAEADLSAAERAPAPVLIRTRKLLIVPLMALASGVAFAAVIAAEPPVKTHDAKDAKITEAEKWRSIDIGGGRTEADAAALREALGMKEQAAALKRSAATLRDGAATKEEHNRALQDAKSVLANSGTELTTFGPADLPDTVPADANARTKLADALDAAARGLSTAAEKVVTGKAGSEDVGTSGEFDGGKGPGQLVPFAPMPLTRDSKVSSLAVQTPSRRQLAQRAVTALDELQR